MQAKETSSLTNYCEPHGINTCTFEGAVENVLPLNIYIIEMYQFIAYDLINTLQGFSSLEDYSIILPFISLKLSF